MIHRVAGDELFLIAQADHARVSGWIVSHVGRGRFGRIEDRRPSVLAAVEHHDAGWAEADAGSRLDGRGKPVDAFHATPDLALAAWRTSADRTEAAAGPYAGLLVSLHGLALSVRANGGAGPGHASFDVSDPHVLFALNRFQHGEIERQERLRENLGLPTDVPLRHGIAEPGSSPADDRLLHHFHWLQAADLLSLCLCGTHLPVAATEDVSPTVGTRPVRLRLARDVAGALRVRPWPFDVERLEGTVRARHLSARSYPSEAAFRADLLIAPWVDLPFVLRP